jgi:hypothetical protein
MNADEQIKTHGFALLQSLVKEGNNEAMEVSQFTYKGAQLYRHEVPCPSGVVCVFATEGLTFPRDYLVDHDLTYFNDTVFQVSKLYT